VRRRRRDRERVARRETAAPGNSRPADRHAVTIHPAELIRRKRDGGELSSDELRELVLGYAGGDVPDYQMAAFCMAVMFRGLTRAETLVMTEAFVGSGETIDMAAQLGRRVVDQHSTGGVGDKTSI